MQAYWESLCGLLMHEITNLNLDPGFCLGDIEWWTKFNLQDTSIRLSPILKML